MKQIDVDARKKSSQKGIPLLRHEKKGSLWKRISFYFHDHPKKKIVFGLLIFALIVVVGSIVRLNTLYSRISTGTSQQSSPIKPEQTLFHVLLMGYGGPGHDGAYLTDTMMYTAIDTKAKRVTLVSIPRDIWVKIPTSSGDEFARKINSVYQTGLFRKNYPDVPQRYDGEDGAGLLLREVVGGITGQPIDNYIAVDFDGFKQVVGTLGGVEVNVQRPFTDPLYPIDGKEDDLCGLAEDDVAGFEEKENIATESPELAYPCRYEVLHFDKGVQTMDGETALKFVRSRHSAEDGGDFNRARRQQLFLEAVRDRVLSLGFIPKIPSLLNDLEENVRTDMSVELIQRLLKEAPHVRDYTIVHVVLTTDTYLRDGYSDDGQYILMSKDGPFMWKSFQTDMKLYLKGLTPTPFPTPTSAMRRAPVERK